MTTIDIPPGMYASSYDDPAICCQCAYCRNSRAVVPQELTYSADGYDQFGYTLAGYDRAGLSHLDRYGYTLAGYDREGWDREGYNRDGYDEDGFGRDGYDADGLNEDRENRYGERYCDDCESAPCECPSCACCGDPVSNDSVTETLDGSEICLPCRRNYYSYCDYCDGYYSDSSSYEHDHDDDDGDGPDTSGLHSYSYKPTPDFHGTGPAYYGMEIEVTSDNGWSLIEGIKSTVGDIAYLKADCSVEGFELVTHPMSYDWAMDYFPWDVLPQARRDGCRIDPGENGIHVHVSRTAFGSPAHLFSWMKLIYRNPGEVQMVARREGSSWAYFRRSHRRAQIQHAKKHGKDRGSMYRDGTQHDRYNAINTQNQATLEVRVFASTLDISEAQTALQLVAGSVEYTRQLTAHDVAAGHGWDWAAFCTWIGAQGDTYVALARLLDVYQPGRELATA